jgi:hypothetical protein
MNRSTRIWTVSGQRRARAFDGAVSGLTNDRPGAFVSFGIPVGLRSSSGLHSRLVTIPLDATFTGELWYWRGPAPFHFVSVPDDVSAAIHAVSAVVSYGWGVIPVRASVGDTTWATSLFPKDGRYVVPIKDAVRRSERLADGDAVTVQLVIRP